jgi:hypothetical protein
MVPTKTARCDTCGKVMPARMAFKADGGWHHSCHGCWNAERKKFVQRLIRGDDKVYRILDVVGTAVTTPLRRRTDHKLQIITGLFIRNRSRRH